MFISNVKHQNECLKADAVPNVSVTIIRNDYKANIYDKKSIY